MASLAFIFAVFVLAGFIKGVLGLGLPTVAVALLSLAMIPAEAAAILVVPSLVTNVWQFAMGPELGPLVRRLFTMMVGVCAGVAIGAGLLTGPDAQHAAVLLGIALVLYAILGLASVRFRVPLKSEPWLSPVVGVATGVVSAATG